jgi:hypothetical protein
MSQEKLLEEELLEDDRSPPNRAHRVTAVIHLIAVTLLPAYMNMFCLAGMVKSAYVLSAREIDAENKQACDQDPEDCMSNLHSDDDVMNNIMVAILCFPVLVPAVLLWLYVSIQARRRRALKGGFRSGAYIRFSLSLPDDSCYLCIVHTKKVTSIIVALFSAFLLTVGDVTSADVTRFMYKFILLFMRTMPTKRDVQQSWVDEGIEHFSFTRPLSHMLYARDKDLYTRLLEALWEANHGHWKRLEGMMDHKDKARAARELMALVTNREATEESN